jgi:hypothetical protein
LCSSNSGNKQRVAADVSFVVELKVFFSFFLSLAFYWNFFPFLSLTGFFFCAVEGREVATEEERGGGHADEANLAREGARERSSDGSCAATVVATNKELLQMFPLLWN